MQLSAKKIKGYPTAFLCTIGHPQPRPDLAPEQPAKVIARTKNNNADIWFLFFINSIISFVQKTGSFICDSKN